LHFFKNLYVIYNGVIEVNRVKGKMNGYEALAEKY